MKPSEIIEKKVEEICKKWVKEDPICRISLNTLKWKALMEYLDSLESEENL